MRALAFTLSLAVVSLLFGCSSESVRTPSLPSCASARVSKGTAVYKEISAPAFTAAMNSFLAQRPLKWHRLSSWASSPAGDVAVGLFDGSERKALVQFSPSFLMIEGYYAEIGSEDADALLSIVGLSRYDAFTPDYEKSPNQRPDGTPVKSPPSNPGQVSGVPHP